MARPHATVQKALKSLLPKDAKFLVAVSGGVDSSVLLHEMVLVKDFLRAHVEVAHVDHALRPTSVEHASFVEKTASRLGVQFHSLRAQEPLPQSNIEAWGRDLRYGFFRKVLQQRSLDWILTAHTADDVAETLLMRLVSNKEPRSILAIDARRKVMRPLLGVSKAEVERYARENSVAFVEDESNASDEFLRNRVRQKLIPLLRSEFDPKISETLSERASGIAEDISFLDSLVEDTALRLGGSADFGEKEWLREVRKATLELDPVLRWRFASRLVKNKLGYNIGRSKGAELALVLLGESQGVELPGGLRLRLSGGGLIVEEKGPHFVS